MNTLELFEFPDFKGDSVCIKEETSDLKFVGFLKRAQSLRIRGDPWVVFSGTDHKGSFQCYKEGNYNSVPAFDHIISSVRWVKGGLYNPKITLYEETNHKGRSLTLEKAANSLKSYGFENKASSHRVESGAWILYTEEYYRGDQTLFMSYSSSYDCTWNNKISSLKPVLAYES